jgi:outer membrane protein assembly factor BamB
MKPLAPLLPLLALTAGLANAADWPQWRGPDRSGVSKEKGLLKSWPAEGPGMAWQSSVAGQGYAGLAVVGGRVYTMGARGDDEYALCLDERGAAVWSAKIGPVFDFRGNSWSRGPNATPTVDGDRVFALGSQGILVCLEKTKGKELWRKDLRKELGGEVSPVDADEKQKMGWGYAWSPLVDGDKLICTPGGARGLFAALDKKTGKVLWRSKGITEPCTYSSPIVAEISSVRQYVYVTQNGPVGVSARDGEVLWFYKKDNPYPSFVCPTPISQANLVYVSVGFNAGCDILKLTPQGKKFKVDSVYSDAEIGNRHGGVVLVGGHVYGYHEERAWECQELTTGEVKWRSKGRKALKAGAVVAADGRLYVVAESGVVALLEASPKGYKEVSRFTLPARSKKRKPRGGLWTPPVLADGKLYVRDQEKIFCFRVK